MGVGAGDGRTGGPGQCQAGFHRAPTPHSAPSCCPRGPDPRVEATSIYSPSVPPQAVSGPCCLPPAQHWLSVPGPPSPRPTASGQGQGQAVGHGGRGLLRAGDARRSGVTAGRTLSSLFRGPGALQARSRGPPGALPGQGAVRRRGWRRAGAFVCLSALPAGGWVRSQQGAEGPPWGRGLQRGTAFGHCGHRGSWPWGL